MYTLTTKDDNNQVHITCTIASDLITAMKNAELEHEYYFPQPDRDIKQGFKVQTIEAKVMG